MIGAVSRWARGYARIAPLLFALWASPVLAQSEHDWAWVLPSPATSNDSVSVFVDSGAPPFYQSFDHVRVERNGRHLMIRARPTLAPPGVVAPDLEVPLGRLAPGRYTIAVVLDVDLLPPARLLGLQVDAAPVPATRPWWLFALVLAMVAMGARGVARRR
jgi:hypothetical protein